MKKIVSLLVFMGILILPLISYAASQPGQFDWRGGPNDSNTVKGKTFDEILARATHERRLSLANLLNIRQKLEG